MSINNPVFTVEIFTENIAKKLFLILHCENIPEFTVIKTNVGGGSKNIMNKK